MIPDVGVHLDIGHRPGAQLAGHILLDGRIAFPADAGKAHRVAKQYVVARPAIEAIGPRQVVDGSSEDGIGQIGGINVGMGEPIRVIGREVVFGYVRPQPDGLYCHPF
ncbi:hypothetical protein D3C78_561300 [compost metagenome]